MDSNLLAIVQNLNEFLKCSFEAPIQTKSMMEEGIKVWLVKSLRKDTNLSEPTSTVDEWRRDSGSDFVQRRQCTSGEGTEIVLISKKTMDDGGLLQRRDGCSGREEKGRELLASDVERCEYVRGVFRIYRRPLQVGQRWRMNQQRTARRRTALRRMGRTRYEVEGIEVWNNLI